MMFYAGLKKNMMNGKVRMVKVTSGPSAWPNFRKRLDSSGFDSTLVSYRCMHKFIRLRTVRKY